MTVPLKRCPKCRSMLIAWVEHVDHTTTFYQSEAGLQPAGVHEPGEVTGIHGRCEDCGHEWVPRRSDGRKARQIWDMPGYPLEQGQ